MGKVVGIIVAGGTGTRFHSDLPKQFLPLRGRPVISHCLEAFEKSAAVDEILISCHPDYIAYLRETVLSPEFHKVNRIVEGGPVRSRSVLNALRALPGTTDIVAIHDAVRPLIAPDIIDRAVELCREKQAVLVASVATDTVKQLADSGSLATLDRSRIFLAQTPQVFSFSLIKDAYDRMGDGIESATDDCSIAESAGHRITILQNPRPNLKITTGEDLRLAESILSAYTEGSA